MSGPLTDNEVDDVGRSLQAAMRAGQIPTPIVEKPHPEIERAATGQAALHHLLRDPDWYLTLHAGRYVLCFQKQVGVGGVWFWRYRLFIDIG